MSARQASSSRFVFFGKLNGRLNGAGNLHGRNNSPISTEANSNMVQAQEEEPFLLHEKDNNTEPSPKSSVADIRQPLRWTNWKLHILAHGVLITIYTLLALAFVLTHNSNSSSAAPQREIVHHKTSPTSLTNPPNPQPRSPT